MFAVLVSIGVNAGVARGEPLADATARVSYSIGHQIGTDLVRQARSADGAAFGEGLRDALEGLAPRLEPDEMAVLLAELKRSIVADERSDRLRGASSLRQAGADFMATNAGEEGVVALASGLQYRVLHAADGRRPGAQDRVEIRYRSTRLDGVPFHDSLREGSPSETHRVDALIPGLEEALQLMPVGSRWQVFIPPNLAFRRRGPLADHTVIYDVELIAIRPSAIEAQAAGGEGAGH